MTDGVGGKRLGELLLHEERLDEASLQRALDAQRLVGGRLGTNLLELGLITEGVLIDALGRQRSSCTAGRAELARVPAPVLRSLPEKLARRHRLVPYLVRGKTIFVASSDPGDLLWEDEISFLTSFMVRTCVALEMHVNLALRQYYKIPIDRRFLALAKRLRDGGTTASRTAPAPAPAPTSPPSTAPSERRPRTTPNPFDVQATPAPAERPTIPPTAPPRTPTTPRTPAPAKTGDPGAAPDLEFIELDDDDLAMLRGAAPSPAPEAPLPAAPASPPSKVTSSSGPIEFAGFVPAEDAFEGFGDLESTVAPALAVGPEDPSYYDDAEGDPDARIATAALALQGADIRDEIGDVLLGFSGVYFARRLLLIARRGHIVGWRGAGEDVDEEHIRTLDLDEKQPSIFAGLRDAGSFWLGPLPQLPANRQLVDALGGPAPRDCLALPVVLRSKVVAHLYVDNLDRGVGGAPIADMKRLAAKAGLAFEVYILKNKIRRL